MLKLENIIKNYDLDQNTKVEALKGINMEINDGEFAFLVGPSGSGKSTIIKLITGEAPLVRPMTGMVKISRTEFSTVITPT